MSSVATRKFVSVREGAHRLSIPEYHLYRAKKRGTIAAAEGPDVPAGLHFEEAELERWAASRDRLQRQGRPKGAP